MSGQTPNYDGNLRCDASEWTEAERAINEAMAVVERAGASHHLTWATVLLSRARQAVAQHVLSNGTRDGRSARDEEPVVTYSQLHAAMDAFYPGEDWRRWSTKTLEIVLRDVKTAIVAARRAVRKEERR